MIKNFISLTLTIVCIIGFSVNAKAQDPQFTQFYANPLYLNPALAGSETCPRATMNYRDQWPGISGNFVTFTASYDQFVKGVYGGVGLQFLRDEAGENTLSNTRIALTYAYTFNLSRSFALKFGAEVAYFQRSLDFSKLTFGDMIDARKGFIYNTNDTPRGGSVGNMDFGAGMFGYSKNFYFGFAAHHLTEPNESLILDESPLPFKFTAHAGSKIPIGDNKYKGSETYISPNIMYMQQAEFNQLLFGLYMQKGPILGGVWYRNQDAFILLIGVEYNDLKFGYSYDITVSTLTTKTAGSHEISVGYNFECRPQKRRFRTISCPSF